MSANSFLARAVLAVCFSVPFLAEAAAQDRNSYMIEFQEPGLLAFQQARSPGRVLDVRAPEVQAWQAELMRQHSDYLAGMVAELGREINVTHYYLATHSGFAARLTEEEADRVARLPGVVSVHRPEVQTIDTYRGPSFIGANTIWDGSSVPGGAGTRGEGITIAVLDTGAVLPHPSFNDDPSCGHGVGGNPPKVLSSLDCSSTNVAGLCNGPSPLDTNGHGTHTASTSGGNVVTSSATPPPAPPAGFTSISGVAPCANLRIYKVCATSSCDGEHITAGMNSVLLHGGVSVMNFSISGGQSPWSSLDGDRRKLDLVNADVLVAASAGNTSTAIPNPVGQVNHRGPWVMSVAASTHDGVPTVLVSASGPGAPPQAATNLPAVRATDSPSGSPQTNLPIRHFTGQPTTSEGCNANEDGLPANHPPFPAGFFNGAAALIHRGTCPFTTKITNAFNAGAVFVIVRNNQAGIISMQTPGQPNVPAYSIQQTGGNALVAFVDANPTTATVDIPMFIGDVLADFSFRGPTPAPLADLQKPNITGPGVGIYAALTGAAGYGNLSGTSMSSPHLAGAAALLRKVHPTWTVTEVVSAIQTTAVRQGTKDTLAAAWDWDDVGSGRVDLEQAVRAGLVFNETGANFLAANPGTGGDPKTLNLPSVRNRSCSPSCSFTRTVRSVLGSSATFDVTVDQPTGFTVQVTPNNFVIPAGGSQLLTITATPNGGEPGTAIRFGAVNLTRQMAASPVQHITVAVQGAGAGPNIFANGFE